MAFADRKTLVKWSQGFLIASVLSAIASLIGRVYIMLAFSALFLVISFFIFAQARKMPAEEPPEEK
ncbi:MAG TPA: hypothetical protein O0X39_02590 [Methanocorpusculum sp.]|nr:hypothetical protein [Methanocorpusculum sp.]